MDRFEPIFTEKKNRTMDRVMIMVAIKMIIILILLLIKAVKTMGLTSKLW